MKYTLETETRELMRAELADLELAVKQMHPEQELVVREFERKILSHSQKNWFARLTDCQEKKTTWQSLNFPPEFEVVHAWVNEPATFLRTDDFILIRHSLKTVDGSRFIIELGEPTAFIKRDVWNLTKVMLLIAVAILFVAPIGGYFLARHAMQPVRNIIYATRELQPARLNSRLPIRGTGDELDQISIEINSFLELISHYLASQRLFTANAAHELRSPLTAIQTSVEVCLAKPRSDSEYCEQLETVSEQCQYLRHLVNQLLELAEVDAATQVNKTKLDLGKLVSKSLSIFSGVADMKRVSIDSRIQPGILFNGDPSKLIQVVNNLIDNAIKFAPEGGHIEVELTKTMNDASLIVRDSGSGVPDNALEKIFERFYQVEGSRNLDSQQGNGLGLSICKSIVELHGGRITAANHDNGGLIIAVVFEIE